jgi:hypothetical protein
MAVGDAFYSAYTGVMAFTGNFNTGTINVPLVHNLAQDDDVAGYNLVSNPYQVLLTLLLSCQSILRL